MFGSSSTSSAPASAEAPLAPEVQVCDDVEVVGEREILVDGRDPELVGVLRRTDRHGTVVDRDRPRIGGLRA